MYIVYIYIYIFQLYLSILWFLYILGHFLLFLEDASKIVSFHTKV